MRTSWDDYFMRIAREVATRATCDRKHVGTVIVRDRSILSTGYNGSIRGMDHCDDVGHLMEDGHCVRTVHAEMNAILQAAKNGVRIDSSTLYVTASPCWSCFGPIVNAGIQRVVFGEAYRPEDPGPKRVTEVAREAKVELVNLSPGAIKKRSFGQWSGKDTREPCATCLQPFSTHVADEDGGIGCTVERIPDFDKTTFGQTLVSSENCGRCRRDGRNNCLLHSPIPPEDRVDES